MKIEREGVARKDMKVVKREGGRWSGGDDDAMSERVREGEGKE